MRIKSFLGIFLILFVITKTFSQNKIILTGIPAKVPLGKKWVIKSNIQIALEVSDGSLESGTLCNALLYSNPKMIGNIFIGEYGNPTKFYGIICSLVSKKAFANENTFLVNPITFFDEKFDINDLQYIKAESLGQKTVTFFQGEVVYVGNCLEKIEVIELPLSPKDIEQVQKRNTDNNHLEKKLSLDNNEHQKQTFTYVEKMPEYKGGREARDIFIKKNLKYPENARKNNIQGQVVVSFIVNSDSTLSDFSISRSLDSQCDEEAIRVLKKMPKWIPGFQNGIAVNVIDRITIRFDESEFEKK